VYLVKSGSRLRGFVKRNTSGKRFEETMRAYPLYVLQYPGHRLFAKQNAYNAVYLVKSGSRLRGFVKRNTGGKRFEETMRAPQIR